MSQLFEEDDVRTEAFWSMTTMQPLEYPDPWPPPGEPPPTEDEVAWRRIPFVGWFIAGRMSRRRWWEHYEDVLKPIEEQIVLQLTTRPRQDTWPDDPERQAIANVISMAVAEEKCIDPPAIHPNDPIEILFWGAFDDLTPLVFAAAFCRRFGVDLPQRDVARFWQDHWTVSDVANHCLKAIQWAKRHRS